MRPKVDYKSQIAKFDAINRTRALTDKEVDELHAIILKEKQQKRFSDFLKDNSAKRNAMVRSWRERNPELYNGQKERKNAKRRKEQEEKRQAVTG